MHAQYAHSPPISSRSTIAVLIPASAVRDATVSPAGPAPITTTSNGRVAIGAHPTLSLCLFTDVGWRWMDIVRLAGSPLRAANPQWRSAPDEDRLFLSSEEWGPRELVELAVKSQDAGFEGLWISDHFHPCNDEQGHSPFVWSVIGAIARATPGVRLTTAVTCPTLRIHPAVIAQAAATSSVLLNGNFSLGVGSGEALNEHIFGDRWPSAGERLEMLEEAVEVMRTLWRGGFQDHRGRHYSIENARIYDLPELPPPVLVSGFGSKSIDLAARIGDCLCTVQPDGEP